MLKTLQPADTDDSSMNENDRRTYPKKLLYTADLHLHDYKEFRVQVYQEYFQSISHVVGLQGARSNVRISWAVAAGDKTM